MKNTPSEKLQAIHSQLALVLCDLTSGGDWHCDALDEITGACKRIRKAIKLLGKE